MSLNRTRDGVKELADALHQGVGQLHSQAEDLRVQYRQLSNAMGTLDEGTSGWEGEASAVCEQVWGDLSFRLLNTAQAIDDYADTLQNLANKLDSYYDNPTQAIDLAGMQFPSLPFLAIGTLVPAEIAAGISIPLPSGNPVLDWLRSLIQQGVAWLAGLSMAEMATAAVEVVAAVYLLYELVETWSVWKLASDAVAQVGSTLDADTHTVVTNTPPPDSPKQLPKPDDPSNSKWPYWVISALIVSGGITALTYYFMNNVSQEDINAIKRQVPGASDDEIRELLEKGFAPDEVVAILKARYSASFVDHLLSLGFTNQQIVVMVQAGFTENEFKELLQAGFTKQDITTIVSRIKQAQRQGGTDRFGVSVQQYHDVIMKIARAINYRSSNANDQRGKNFEGETAKRFLANIVDFQKQVTYTDIGPDGQPVQRTAEVDIELPHVIIEVTLQDSDKLGQTEDYIAHRDPDGKPIILYAPNYGNQATRDIEALNHDPTHNPDGIPVWVARNERLPDGSNRSALQELYDIIRTYGDNIADTPNGGVPSV